MRVLVSASGSRGDVEPVVGLAVRLRALGATVAATLLADAVSWERPPVSA